MFKSYFINGNKNQGIHFKQYTNKLTKIKAKSKTFNTKRNSMHAVITHKNLENPAKNSPLQL